MNVEVNWIAVVLAAVASMVVGMVWYAKPVFGKMWMKLTGLDEKRQQQGAMRAIVQAAIASLVTAYVLAHVTYISQYFFQVSFLESAMNTAFWLWLGFSAATLVTHNAFEQKPAKLTLLALGNQLVTLLAMGAIIGWLAP